MIQNCPICKKEMTLEFKPFCSKRCKEVDLGRWFLESYSIPTEESEDSDEVELNSDDVRSKD